MTDNELAPTRRIGADTLFAAFEALKDNGGELPMREVLREVESRVELDDWAKEKYEKTHIQPAQNGYFQVVMRKTGKKQEY